MTVLAIAALVLVAWCLLPLPVAVAVGRAFREGANAETVEPARAQEAAGV